MKSSPTDLINTPSLCLFLFVWNPKFLFIQIFTHPGFQLRENSYKPEVSVGICMKIYPSMYFFSYFLLLKCIRSYFFLQVLIYIA